MSDGLQAGPALAELEKYIRAVGSKGPGWERLGGIPQTLHKAIHEALCDAYMSVYRRGGISTASDVIEVMYERRDAYCYAARDSLGRYDNFYRGEKLPLPWPLSEETYIWIEMPTEAQLFGLQARAITKAANIVACAASPLAEDVDVPIDNHPLRTVYGKEVL